MTERRKRPLASWTAQVCLVPIRAAASGASLDHCELVHHGPVEVFLASSRNPLGSAISPHSRYGRCSLGGTRVRDGRGGKQ